MAKDIPSHIAERLPAAAAVFARDGVDHARMAEIVDATGIPRATLYYYFEGKEDILCHLVRYWLEMLADTVRSAATGPSQWSRLENVIAAQVDAMILDSATTQVVMANLGRVAQLPEVASELERAIYQPLADILADGVRDGSFDVVDPQTTAVAIAGAMSLPVIHDLAAGQTPDPRTLTESILRFVRQGVGGA